MANSINLEISNEIVMPIVTAKIQTAIIEAMGGSNALVEGIVSMTLNHACDENGKISNYSSDNKFRWIDVIMKKTIQNAAKAAVESFVLENGKQIEAEIKKQLSTKKGLTQLVTGYMEGITSAVADKWRLNFKFELDKER